MRHKYFLIMGFAMVLSFLSTVAQNPIIRNQFTADPTARAFNGKIYLYPSHDIIAPKNKGVREGWFCMEDYHVFSSENLTDWTDHGVIVTQTKVPWLTKVNYNMWAPDCVFKNGKYYFYFPVGGKIGIATADKPEGPYTVLDQPLAGIGGIDPCVLLDKDGVAYIFTAKGLISVAKLKDNMLEVDGDVQTIANLPVKGLIEGPFAFGQNGKYYLTYPHVENKIERLEYAMSDSPTGPYKPAGIIMDESASGCWTNHQSIVQYKGQWYLFYHDKDYSPGFDKNRSVRIDSLFFNADGTIKKVKPTLRGVGLTRATDKIQLDRYSCISDKGATIAYNDTLNYFDGWKTILSRKNSWIQYNAVDFDAGNYKYIEIRYLSPKGGMLILNQKGNNGKAERTIKIPASAKWTTAGIRISGIIGGIQNLLLTNVGNNPVEIDWIRFK